MARTILRRVPLTIEQKRERNRRRRVLKGNWLDPYSDVMGTKPEKMVYAELVRRQIPFLFQEWLYIDLDIDSNKWYRPDIQIPELKVIIEVQGSYFHSKPEAIEKDSFKYSLYQAQGWKVLMWWDFDIETRLFSLFDSEPSLRPRPFNPSYRRPIPSRPIDDLKGLRKANQKKRKPWTKKAVGVKIKKRRK